MNLLVAAFFLHNVLATLFLGFKFKGQSNPTFKNFGRALILISIAFAIWTTAILFNLDLESYVTVGAAFFAAALVMLLAAGIQSLKTSQRHSIILWGSLLATALFLTRTLIYPSQPGFSPEGLFFFSPHPIIQIAYIFGLALTALPAINAVADKLKGGVSYLVRYGFIAEVMGGIILITSTATLVLYIAGWIIGITYFALWTTLLFNKKVWRGSK